MSLPLFRGRRWFEAVVGPFVEYMVVCLAFQRRRESPEPGRYPNQCLVSEPTGQSRLHPGVDRPRLFDPKRSFRHSRLG